MKVWYDYAPREERAAGQAPDVLDILTSVPCVRSGDRGDSEADPERRSRRLPCESGVEHLENGIKSKICLNKEECEDGRK